MPTQISFCMTTVLISPRRGRVKIICRLRGVNNQRKEKRFTEISKLIRLKLIIERTIVLSSEEINYRKRNYFSYQCWVTNVEKYIMLKLQIFVSLSNIIKTNLCKTVVRAR